MDNAIEYKEKYLVLPEGKVWRKKRGYFVECSTRIRQADKGKGGGYEYVDLCFDGKIEYWLVHRLVAKLFVPNPKKLPQVNHINGDRSDNRAENLEWSCASNNQKHAYKVLGRTRKSKLTEEQMKEIYSLRNNDKLSLNTIADMYNIPFQTVSEIALGKRFCFRTDAA